MEIGDMSLTTDKSSSRKYARLGGLIACLAAPLTTVAALSGTIAPKLGVSQGSVLAADGVALAALLALLAWRLRG